MNVRRFFKFSLVICFAAMCCERVVGAAPEETVNHAQPSVQEWGHLSGTFLYDGKAPERKQIDTSAVRLNVGPIYDPTLIVGPNGGVANVVVYVRTKDVPIHKEYEKTAQAVVNYVCRNLQFEPHVQVVRTTQSLEFRNLDPIFGNVNFMPLGGPGLNPLLLQAGAIKFQPTRQQFIPQVISCNIHPWKKGFILIRDNPYFAVTDETGKFEIKNLPARELEFQFWHERAGYLVALPAWDKGRMTLMIKPGENVLSEKPIKLSPKLFEDK